VVAMNLVGQITFGRKVMSLLVVTLRIMIRVYLKGFLNYEE